MKNSIPHISSILLAIVIAACNVTKNNVKPEAELPAKFRNQNVAQQPASGSGVGNDTSSLQPVIAKDDSASALHSAYADSSGIANLTWKNFFTDPVLQKLLDTAIAKNYDMQLAIKNIETAQLLLKQSRWGYAPDISLQVTAGSNRPSDKSLNGLSASQFLKTTHIEDFTAAVTLSW